MILVKELGAIALIYVFIHILMRSLHHSKTTANPRQLPPGPQGYPIVGALPLLLRKNPHATLAELAKTYGPITYLKVGTEGMVVASSPDAVRAFLKTHDSNFMDRPRNAGSTLLGYNSQDMVFGRYDAKWKLLRKLSNVHMMGSQALAESMDIRASEVGHMLVAMYQASERGEMVVVPHMLMYGIANMIGQIMLSQRIFATKGNEVNEFRDLVVEVMRSAGRFNIGDFIPSIAWMDLQGIEKQFKRMHLKFDYLISGMLDEHEASAHTRKDKHDFVDILMANRDSSNDDERLTTTNIKALILNSLLAGTDTTSSAIEWALVEMIKNPTILKRAQEEMDRVIGRNRRFLESDIPGLPYLRAICMETFRLHPSTPLNLPRVASEDCIIDGYYIPKNTRLSVNIWAIGRDPTVWEDPLYFNPDRFMSGEYAKMDPVGDDFRLVTFGAGRRYCAGSKMGVVLVEYLLGTFVHSFDWKLPKEVGEINMDEGFGLALQKAIPTAAFVTPRLGLHCYAT